MTMSTFLLFAISATAGETPQYWELEPRLTNGQEVLYKGTITHRNLAEHGATYEQLFEIRMSMFVLGIDADRSRKIGCYTLVSEPGTSSNPNEDLSGARSVHFDLVKVSPRGLATWAGSDAHIALPPDGSVPWELGYLFELPEEPVSLGTGWIFRRPGQPPIQCKVEKVENVLGVWCIKIRAEQQSQNWSARNVNITAWQNHTWVWIDPKTGLVQRLHRDYQFRKPGGGQNRESVSVHYDLTSNLNYGGQIHQQRVSDFRAAFRVQNAIDLALTNVDYTTAWNLKATKADLEFILDQPYVTPYRPAISRMHDRVCKSLEKLHMTKASSSPQTQSSSQVKVGKRARNFVVRDVETKQSITLTKKKGTPIVLVFVDPGASLSLRALRTTLGVLAKHESARAQVLVICQQADPEITESLRQRVPGKYSICIGHGIYESYGVDALPHTLFIDGQGTLRTNYPGWGPELHTLLAKSLSDYSTFPEKIGRKFFSPDSSRR